MKRKFHPALLVALSILLGLTLVYLPPVQAVSTKITLTTSMVTNESGLGNAAQLVDEQSTAGDPKNQTGGSPTSVWFPGWGGSAYPASAYIDLGQIYNLTDVYLRDLNDSGNIIIAAGSPGNWSTLFTDSLGNYNQWNGHQVSVATRYIRVTKSTETSNMSELVLYGTPAGGGADVTAPAAVTNLSAGSATSSSLQLSWTAPGDDGNTGTATVYDIRYSTSPITGGNWNSATQASGEPAPAIAGTSQSYALSGLAASTTYYVALKTRDEANNESGLSNIASLATTSSGGGGSGGKLALSPSMVTNESSLGNAGELVDEQSLSGDPKNGTGGAPTTNWFPGWSGSAYPASAYIDLGQNYDLSDVYIRDLNASGDLVISTGSPGNWTVLFTDTLGNYNSWNAHAVSATTRYVRVTKGGTNSNAAEIVLYGSPAGGGGGDVTAPGAVTNLSIGNATSSSLQLTWSAPGDDGNSGTASVYDIRYSTSPITTGNWSSATPATGEPSPALAGTTQTYTLSGLNAGTTYYAALKTRDEVNNESGLSNVASGATQAGSGGGTSGKITLTAGMILNETTAGDATKLVDEQTLAGNPKGGTGGVPSSSWDMGNNSFYLPAKAVIDLGTEYALSDVYLFDSNGSGNVTVSYGTPFAWTTLLVDGMGSYNQWKAHTVSATTRYLQITFASSGINMPEIVLYGSALGTPAGVPARTPHTQPIMNQFIGINAFIDDPLDKMQVAGFVREYHNWNWDEGDAWPFGSITTSYPGYPNNANKFNPSYAGGGWNFDAYYANLKNAGITAVPAIQGSVSWMTTGSNHKPLFSGENALLPASYAEHADHMYQYAARYGSTAVADANLKLAAGQPRSTGLGTLSYFENWNEQDKWWDGRVSYFNPYEYAAMSSADFDGHLGTMGSTHGVKNADPNAKMVMGGLANPNLEYVRALKFWADFNRGGSFPFDVINIHHYSNNGGIQGGGTAGISPEEDGFKEKLAKFVEYRDRYLPGKEVWITEFGYDTHPNSPQRAPSIGQTSQLEVQGRWIVRSYLAAAAAGVDRAAMYMLRDVDPNSSTQYDTSGLVSSQGTGYQPKPSWYYVYTLNNRLGNMRYIGEVASGNPNVMIYKFKDISSNAGAYVVWSPNSNNTTVNGYSLSLAGSPTSATLVELVNGDTDGATSALTIQSGAVSVNVSEKPLFVMVNQIQ